VAEPQTDIVEAIRESSLRHLDALKALRDQVEQASDLGRVDSDLADELREGLRLYVDAMAEHLSALAAAQTAAVGALAELEGRAVRLWGAVGAINPN
jgi:hypothetical protein